MVGNIVICYATIFGITRKRLVARIFIIWFGILEYNVPGMQKSGHVAEAAESKVDDGVGRADAYFDPH